MNKTLFAMLTESEKRLLLSAEPAALRGLDEDDLATLHDRVRHAQTSTPSCIAVALANGSRRMPHADALHDVNVRTARKAELFEDALARVSRHLARAAAEAAQGLKAERLRAAQRGVSKPPAVVRPRRTEGGRNGSREASDARQQALERPSTRGDAPQAGSAASAMTTRSRDASQVGGTVCGTPLRMVGMSRYSNRRQLSPTTTTGHGALRTT